MRTTFSEARLGVALAVAHLALVSAHGVAHLRLGLLPSGGEGAFIATFIYLGPLVAALLLARGDGRRGMAALAVTMLAALAFETHHHFLVVSPDHVAHLPSGSALWRAGFRVTAWATEPVDALAAALGLWSLATLRRTPKPQLDGRT